MSLNRTDSRFKLLQAFFWMMILGFMVEGTLIVWELAANVPKIALAVGLKGQTPLHPTALTTGIFGLLLVLYFGYKEYLVSQGASISHMDLITQKVEEDAE